jgi:hypothetical protein
MCGAMTANRGTYLPVRFQRLVTIPNFTHVERPYVCSQISEFVFDYLDLNTRSSTKNITSIHRLDETRTENGNDPISHEYQLCTKGSEKRRGIGCNESTLHVIFLSFSSNKTKTKSLKIHKSLKRSGIRWFAPPEPPRSSHVCGIARGTEYGRMCRRRQ